MTSPKRAAVPLVIFLMSVSILSIYYCPQCQKLYRDASNDESTARTLVEMGQRMFASNTTSSNEQSVTTDVPGDDTEIAYIPTIKEIEATHLSTPMLTAKPYNSELAMRERAKELQKLCSNSEYLNKGPINQYIASKSSSSNNSYVYYPIAKCGWTNWMYIMFQHAGRPDEPSDPKFEWGWGSPYDHAGMKKIRVSELKQYKERLLFVRHPFDRLVSAYKNKALNGPYSLWMHTPCKWLKEDMPSLTFPQFTTCIVEKARQVDRNKMHSQNVARNLDIHWTPQFWSALPCSSNYSLIGRFENLNDDMNEAINILHLNATNRHMNAGKKYENETLGYWFNQLTTDVKEDLRKIYKLDFQYFNFDDTIPS